jgi:ABC-type branched-subunit amino acid transport system substrate-binding protein
MQNGDRDAESDRETGKTLLNNTVSRRDLLKYAGAAGIVLGATGGLGGVLAACGGSGTSSGGASGSTEPIKFGIMGSMGDASGLNVSRPAEMMFKDINANGGILGHQCEIVGPLDDHNETAQAITAFDSLVQQGCKVILGGSIDDVESALSRIARAPDVLYLSMFASTQAFMVNVLEDYQHYKNYFMYTPTDRGLYFCVQNPALLLKEKNGWSKVYMMREDMAWTEGVEQFYKDEAPKAGSVVPVDVEDLTPYFRQAEQAGAQIMMTFISVFGEKLATQAWESKFAVAMLGHNGILNDYGYWQRSNGSWGPMATTSTWGSLEKATTEWRDFVTQWYTTYTDDPRTPMWLGECTWRGIKSYKEAAERANSIETDPVIKELEKTYYPDAPVAGGFYGDGQGDWPHTWSTPVDPNLVYTPNPTRGAGLWESSPYSPMTQWQPPDIAPKSTFMLPGEPADYGRLVTVYPVRLAGGDYQEPPFFPGSPNA